MAGRGRHQGRNNSAVILLVTVKPKLSKPFVFNHLEEEAGALVDNFLVGRKNAHL